MPSLAHLDVLLEVLDTPIWFIVLWPPTSVNSHLPRPVKFMQRLFGEVLHSIHVFCFNPLAFTTVVNIEARERGDEGNENEPIARRELRPLLKKRRWKSRVLEDSLNSSKARLRCQGRLWIRLGHGRKNPRQRRCLPKMKLHEYTLHICFIYSYLNADTGIWSISLMGKGAVTSRSRAAHTKYDGGMIHATTQPLQQPLPCSTRGSSTMVSAVPLTFGRPRNCTLRRSQPSFATLGRDHQGHSIRRHVVNPIFWEDAHLILFNLPNETNECLVNVYALLCRSLNERTPKLLSQCPALC